VRARALGKPVNMDLGCLIAESLRLLRERPAVRRQIQRIYKYICVDEFEDTNKPQYDLLTQIVNAQTSGVARPQYRTSPAQAGARCAERHCFRAGALRLEVTSRLRPPGSPRLA